MADLLLCYLSCAGKSFSMVGYGVNKGIIPMVCSDMFKTVDKAEAGKKYEVQTTMLEIYNEVIRDLLNPSSNVAGGLKVRSKPGIGVYVEGLLEVPCTTYEQIEARMDEGTGNRTVAATKMNATSSRAHTVFGISFTTKTEVDGAVSELKARMNLVDLAGSERAESTGATGDRLKEGYGNTTLIRQFSEAHICVVGIMLMVLVLLVCCACLLLSSLFPCSWLVAPLTPPCRPWEM
jgi:kinesin family protein 1